MWVMHSRNAEANGACAMIRMPAMSECAAPKRRDASETVGTCCYICQLRCRLQFQILQKRDCKIDPYTEIIKRLSLSLGGFRMQCATQCTAASCDFRFRGRIAP